jgi:hypothetical protein
MEANDIAIRTLFAEFQEAVFKRFALGKEVCGEWTFISKQIKGRKYWYQQCYVDGKPIQKYYLPSTSENDKIVLKKRAILSEKNALIKKLFADEQKRSAMLKRGGVPGLDYLTSSVVSILSENFLVYKGGVLIGSHAFQAYSGIFGATFEKSSLRTLDIDIACENTVTAYSAIPLNVGDLLKKVEKGFKYVPSLSNKYPPSSFVGPSGMRVDIVTPLRGKPRNIVKIRNIVDVAAIPLRFLDFLIKEPVDSVLIGVRGGIPVTIPHPARYAIHKLIISSQRPVSELAKSAKDIIQAEQIILICAKEQLYELKMAFNEAMRQGPKWKRYIEKGISKLSSDARSALSGYHFANRKT